MDREAWRAAVHGVSKSRHNWAAELKCKKATLKRIHMEEFHVCNICKTNIYKEACELMDASIWWEGGGSECGYEEVTEAFCDCMSILTVVVIMQG